MVPIHEYITQHVVHSGHVPLATAATVDVPLDHFNLRDTRTWAMRYWVDDRHFDAAKGGPVFLSMGGEGASGPPGGQMAEMAQDLGGLLFSIEHRYYGDSIPSANFSTGGGAFATENLQWLGTEQALADAAFFRSFAAGKFNLTIGTRARDVPTPNRWVTVGGSYSGELAAWARLKYPHLFHCAIASSAPVTASIDFWGYDPIVAAALNRTLVGGSPACHAAVKDAFGALEALMDSDRPALSKLFGTCGAVVTDGDCYQLHDYVSDDFM
jgi:serine protease 16